MREESLEPNLFLRSWSHYDGPLHGVSCPFLANARSANFKCLGKVRASLGTHDSPKKGGQAMMDGMMGMGGTHMVIWGIVGILLIVLLVVLIWRLIK